MITVSENSTDLMMGTHYKLLHHPSAPIFKELYSHLISAASGTKSTLSVLENGITMFFRKLFPLVYQHELHPNKKNINPEFSVCLQDSMDDIRPFGEVSRQLASQLSRSFQTPLSVIDSITLIIEVLNATNQYEYHSECYSALTKMTQCSLCNGLVSARPCSGYCMNVARGCLAGLLDLDQPWNQLTSALEQIGSGGGGFEENLAQMGNKISDGIMYFMVNGLHVEKRVSSNYRRPHQ